MQWRRNTLGTLALGVGLGSLWASVAAGIPREERAQLELDAAAGFEDAVPGAAYSAIGRVRIEPGWHVNANAPTFEYLIPTALTVALPEGWPAARVSYPAAVLRKFSFENEPLAVYEGVTEIGVAFDVPAGAAPGTVPVRGTLRYQACSDTVCLPPVETSATLDLRIAGASQGPGAPGASGSGEGGKAPNLAWMLLLALAGGLILNAMPCVLPVVSLKVFGLVQTAGAGRRHVAMGALATAAGILASFWALAATAIAVRAAGGAVGWGVQFQNPAFVAFLGVVIVLFCLNLWGLFEMPMPSRLARVAAAGPSEGLPGHFASGLFATLMATPCSAPFLGTAVGFALAQPAPVVFAILTAVGLGMALPYFVLAVAPGTARLLPRPGSWMDQLKVVMGFLLAASAVWIFYVLAAQVPPERLAVVQLALLALALCAWIRHRHLLRLTVRRVAGLGMLAAAVLAIVAVRSGAEPPSGNGSAVTTARRSAPGLIQWQPWSRAEAESLAAAGRLVFVDVTADWCFTCKVNERVILETPEVAAAFARYGVVPLKADWTNRDDTIAEYLAHFGRAGIPFYALYRPGQEPLVFAELLTKDGLLADLAAAAAAQAQPARGTPIDAAGTPPPPGS